MLVFSHARFGSTRKSSLGKGCSTRCPFYRAAESFDLGLVEAMAVGCPVAAADLPYAHDVAGEAAIYFNPKDPESIAKSIVALLNDDNFLKRLKSIGAERKMRFSHKRIADAVATALEDTYQEGRTG